jgi:acyl-coenzyme A thioesterase PaaI-like protein
MLVDEDDEPLVEDHTDTARTWANQHPWISYHSPTIQRVLGRGESELSFPPKAWSGSPYGTFNGGCVVTACLAAAQMAATYRFGERAAVVSADATFIAGATLDLPLRVRAEYVQDISSSRIAVVSNWYQIGTPGVRQSGGLMFVELAKAKPSTPLIAVNPEPSSHEEGDLTIQVKQLVAINPYFSHMGVNILQVTEKNEVEAYMEPDIRMQNTQGTWPDGVLNAFGDAIVCFASVPAVGPKPATAKLKFMRLAQAPANARVFGQASVSDVWTEKGRVRTAVHGRAYYHTKDGERVVIALYDALIVGT